MVTLEEHLARKCIHNGCGQETFHMSYANGMFSCLEHEDELLPLLDVVGRLECWYCEERKFISQLTSIDNPEFTICEECIILVLQKHLTQVVEIQTYKTKFRNS